MIPSVSCHHPSATFCLCSHPSVFWPAQAGPLPPGLMQGRSLCCLRTEPPGGKAGCVVPPDAPCRQLLPKGCEIGPKARCAGADLSGLDLRFADLRGADLRGARLIGTDFENADLSGAQLERATLIGTDLPDARLLATNLRGALVRSCDLESSDLTGADLTGADMS
jgi:Pentapeptide repeats (8 copies)